MTGKIKTLLRAPDPLYSGWLIREVFVSPSFLTIEEPEGN